MTHENTLAASSLAFMRVSDLLDLDWRAAKKPQLLESVRAFNQVTGEDLKWVGNFAAQNLSLSQQSPPKAGKTTWDLQNAARQDFK